MAKNPLDMLEDNNIRSLDLYTGEQVNDYLFGDSTKRELVSVLKDRKKEMTQAIKGIDKLLTITTKCPARVVQDEE